MFAETYELISQGFRYWFVFLGIAIVLRSYRWALQDHRRLKRILKTLPDAGLIGEVVNLATGESQPLPREGMIGSSKSCDIYFSGIRKFELEFVYVDGRGVSIIPSHHHHQILLQNSLLGKTGYVLHGSRLNLPGYSLRFRLFAGLNLPEQTYAGKLQDDISAFGDEFDIESLGEVGMPMDSFGDINLPTQAAFQTDSSLQFEQEGYISDTPNEKAITWDPQMTWQYAPPPPETKSLVSLDANYLIGQPVWEQDDYEKLQSDKHVRKRRSKRHEN